MNISNTIPIVTTTLPTTSTTVADTELVPTGPPEISEKDKEALVYSNFIYLLPVLVLFYKYVFQNSINLSGMVILAVFYTATMLYSINYHLCQKRKDPTDDDLISKCYNTGMFYTQAQTNDLTMANYSLFITFLYIIPIHNELRIILQSIGILWVITTQSFTNVFNNILYSTLPALLVGIFYLIYLVTSFKHLHIFSQCLSVLGCILSFVASALFLFFRNNYGLTHTLWHVFGGISGACLLFPAVIGDDKFKWTDTFKYTRRDPTLSDTKL